jgi:tRNA (mo5U34)-methyltransferase
MDIKNIVEDIVPGFQAKLLNIQNNNKQIAWYPYGTLENFHHLNKLLTVPYRELDSLIGSKPILDIGCADGAVGFLLESLGYKVDFCDFAPTNFNHLTGLKTLQTELGSQSELIEIDLDSQWNIQKSYGLVIFLGLLYHLKNPFYVLEKLSYQTKFCLLSTRVFQQTKDAKHNLENTPVAYLLGPSEANNDSTNYWIFSRLGLVRLLERTGWMIHCERSLGCTQDSNPSDSDKDERIFCLLESTR